MTLKFVFATTNKGKLAEVQSIAQIVGFELILPNPDWGPSPEVEEGTVSYQENARLKAEGFFQWCHLPVVADDTGLEVDCLQGAPGILSARYAGKDATMATNKQLLLTQIGATPEPTARFRCMLCYYDGISPPTYAEDTLEGIIRPKQQGSAGFGYDDLFEVQGHAKTLSQLKEGNFTHTHRFKAFQKLLEALKKE